MRLGVRRGAPVAVAALVLATSSCGGDTADDAAAEPSTTPAATAAPNATGPAADSADGPATGPADGSSEPADQPNQPAGLDEPQAQVAVADLANFSCTRRDSGAWFAEGDITNPTTEPMIYTLTVATVEGATEVAGERVKEFVLQPDETTSFDLARFARGAADGCMPRLLRTPR